MELSYIDIGILVLLILLSIKGIWQGLIRGLASLLGILLGIFFASRFYEGTGNWFAENVYNLNSSELNSLVGFLILITFIWSAFLLLGELVSRTIKITPLAVLDGALGLIFGFIKSFLLISIIVFGVSQIAWLQNFSQSIETSSSLFPVMKQLAINIMNLDQVQEIKENLNLNTDSLQNGAENIKQEVQEMVEKTQKIKEDK